MPTLLVIDDEIIIQRLVTHTLQALKIKVISAMDAELALEIAAVTPVDMLLVDINLPDLDGFSLMAHLKEIPAIKDVPMVAFTARNDPDDEARALALGARRLIYKPFSTTELRDLIRSVLKLRERPPLRSPGSSLLDKRQTLPVARPTAPVYPLSGGPALRQSSLSESKHTERTGSV